MVFGFNDLTGILASPSPLFEYCSTGLSSARLVKTIRYCPHSCATSLFLYPPLFASFPPVSIVRSLKSSLAIRLTINF
jgi:hypothetical protein